MSKWIDPDTIDLTLLDIKNNCNALRICTSDVLTGGVGDYSKCTGASALTGNITVTSGSFTIADGTTGRKITVAEQTAIPVTATGTAAHLALLDTIETRVIAIATTRSKSLTESTETDLTEFSINLPQPV